MTAYSRQMESWEIDLERKNEIRNRETKTETGGPTERHIIRLHINLLGNVFFFMLLIQKQTQNTKSIVIHDPNSPLSLYLNPCDDQTCLLTIKPYFLS